MQYAYQARDAAGAMKAGELAAETIAEVAAALRRDGLFPVEIAPRADRPAAGAAPAPLFAPRVKAGEVVHFATQLAVMADAGVPLGQALRDLAAQSGGGGLPPILERVARAVDGGATFSDALARFPKAFDPTFVNLVKAGEASGQLPEMLDRTADRLAADLETRRKLVGAMIYPAAMLTLCLCSVGFLMSFVFPKIMPLFDGRELELPGPTKLLVAVSDSLTNYWPAYLIGAAAAVVGMISVRRSPAGRAAWDRAVLDLPVVGPLLRKVSLSRSLRTLAATVSAGVPMLESLKLAGAVAGNAAFAAGWRAGAEKVAGGTPLNVALGDNALFPPRGAANDEQRRADGQTRPGAGKGRRPLRPRSRRRPGLRDAADRTGDDRADGRRDRHDRPGDAVADLPPQRRRGVKYGSPRREPRRLGPATSNRLGSRLGLPITPPARRPGRPRNISRGRPGRRPKSGRSARIRSPARRR